MDEHSLRPWDEEDVTFTVIFFIILVSAVFGNSMFIAAVAKNKKLYSSVFVFLGNQCISDILCITMSIFFWYQIVTDTWPFGEAWCRLIGFGNRLTITVSIFSLSVVAVERWILICNINKNKKTMQWCLKAIAGIWVISALVCSPLLYGFGLYVYEYPDVNSINFNVPANFSLHNLPVETRKHFLNLIMSQGNYTMIKGKVCDTLYWSKTAGLTYFCILAVITYIIPLAILAVTHWKIFQALRKKGTTPINDDNKGGSTSKSDNIANDGTYARTVADRQADKILKTTARNQQIVKMLMTITITFFVLWSPIFVVEIVRTKAEIPLIVWKVVMILMLVSTTTNFYITLKLSTEFKKTVASLLKCRGFRTAGEMELPCN